MTEKQEARLIGRAIREGWPVSAEQRKVCIDALMDMVATKDPELVDVAVSQLLKADAINVKLAELEHKQIESDDNKRLRLLELAKSVPVAELARRAADRGIVVTADGS